MLDKATTKRMTSHLTKAIEAQKRLKISLARAQLSLAAYNASLPQNLIEELVEASDTAYEVARHIDKAGVEWEKEDR
jgi:hypothetical protein